MAIEQRIIDNTGNAQWRRVVLANTTTTDATLTPIYQSNIVIPEGRVLRIQAVSIVYTPTASEASTIISTALVARAIGGNLRVAGSQFNNAQGEINPAHASQSITADGVAQRFYVNVQGFAATTYRWTTTIEILRNA